MNKSYPEKVINAFLKYDKITDIMKDTGLSRGTIDKYRKDEEFQKVLFERKELFVAAAVSKMQTALSKGVDVLKRIIENEAVSPQVRVNAISVLFAQCKAWTTELDLLKRIEALEKDME
ncbi:MAG: hypothetical protein J1E64_04890 [Acetatifactor sp.]|nr:hypothetical protein [Acetatifactor sp.]